MPDRCDNCGGRRDRPGLFKCEEPGHPAATLAQAIVADIEAELSGRRGMSWDGLADAVADKLRDRLAAIVDRRLAGMP